MPARKPITMEAVLVEPQEREFWTLRSLPPYETFTGPEYFYDGELPVVNGRIQVPVSQPTRIVGRSCGGVGMEVEQAAGTEAGTRRLQVEAHRPALTLEAQLVRRIAAAAARKQLLERHRVQPPLRRVEPRQKLARYRLAGPVPPPEAAPPALTHITPREQQLDPHPLRENQLPPLRVVLYRRFMVRIAETLAPRVHAKALVTGESLGQVASQTLDKSSPASTPPSPAPGSPPCARGNKKGSSDQCA